MFRHGEDAPGPVLSDQAHHMKPFFSRRMEDAAWGEKGSHGHHLMSCLGSEASTDVLVPGLTRKEEDTVSPSGGTFKFRSSWKAGAELAGHSIGKGG